MRGFQKVTNLPRLYTLGPFLGRPRELIETLQDLGSNMSRNLGFLSIFLGKRIMLIWGLFWGPPNYGSYPISIFPFQGYLSPPRQTNRDGSTASTLCQTGASEVSSSPWKKIRCMVLFLLLLRNSSRSSRRRSSSSRGSISRRPLRFVLP